MKIRYWLAGYTAGMLLLFGYLCYMCHMAEHPQSSRDMVYYNEQQMQIEQALTQGVERSAVEQQYNCEILFLSDTDYKLRLQDALKAEALVVDYMAAGETFTEGRLIGKIIWREEEQHYQMLEQRLYRQMLWLWGMLLTLGYVLLIFIYFKIMRPFHRLQRFSRQVAKGNLDFPLPMNKHDYFGAFTESFDLMREELRRARESEYQANKSKRELMAELSHDIKTPIATIQAACEILQLKEENPVTLEKIALIDTKAKMIHKLVDNLFHAALEELSVLKVEPVEESTLCIREMFSDMGCYGELRELGNLPECLVYMDRLRLQQVIDNCLNNAWKYAGTPVEIHYQELENGIQIKIKDEGEGVSEEELPLISEKFYRGSNARGKEGSGLGLYLAQSFMKQMKGDMEYYNQNGFVVQLFLQKV